MSELKPCPFCGEKATLDYSVLPNRKHWFITCDCCGMMYQYTLSQRKYVKDGWNTRPIEDALRARIAELEAESERFTVHSRIKRQDDKWIPVSERLPEKQKLTIGFTDNSAYVFFEIVNDDEMGLVMYPYQNRKGTVTHWMPLPSTPEVQE